MISVTDVEMGIYELTKVGPILSHELFKVENIFFSERCDIAEEFLKKW